MGTNPQFPADLFTFTKEILNGKLHLLCSVMDYLFMGQLTGFLGNVFLLKRSRNLDFVQTYSELTLVLKIA